MVGLGFGEILGSLLYGKINDKFSVKITIAANVLGSIFAFSVMIIYAVRFEFNLAFGFLVTFAWGLQDSGMNNMIYSVLGF